MPTGLNAATLIGDKVTIEPYAVLRSCRVENKCIVGARSVLCEGSVMETESILAPNSVVPPARRIPSGELWGGNPAKFIRKLTANEVGQEVSGHTGWGVAARTIHSLCGAGGVAGTELPVQPMR